MATSNWLVLWLASLGSEQSTGGGAALAPGVGGSTRLVVKRHTELLSAKQLRRSQER